MRTPVAALAGALVLSTGCPATSSAGGACEGGLFGLPGPSTGLDADQCSGRCSCPSGEWAAPSFDDATLDRLAATTLLDPPPVPESDPYELDPPVRPASTVCAVLPEVDTPGAYRLATVPAGLPGATRITHHGACGLCSSLQDLAVYLRYPDLTGPVRECGLLSITTTDDDAIACLEALGFSVPCARIWFYNTRSTRTHCLGECLAALDAPYHLPDGSLNECLLCDEEVSGPVFKAVAGRTRRNSGLASAICRPCGTIRPVDHDYRAVLGD